MAATKYQILYKMTNPNSNTMINNTTTEDVKQYIEMYQDQHKIEIGTDEQKMEAINERNQRIQNSSNPSNEKYNTLYQYTGTKRINKKVWMPESEGYVIRNFGAVRDQITNAYSDGDYSGNFILLESDTPESGVVVCKKDYFEKNYVNHGLSGYFYNTATNSYQLFQNQDYVAVLDNSNLASNKKYFKDYDELKEALFSKTIADIDFELNTFELSSIDIANMAKQTDSSSANAGLKYYTGDNINKGFFMFNTYGTCTATIVATNYGNTVQTSYKPDGICNIAIQVGEFDNIREVTTNSNYKWNTNNNHVSGLEPIPKTFAQALTLDELSVAMNDGRLVCTQAVYLLQHVKKYTIPAHYEDVIDYPYCIYDAYEKIQQEPWFEYRICDSLTDAITSVEKLVEKIGLENVKLVKLVPTGQFIKIK